MENSSLKINYTYTKLLLPQHKINCPFSSHSTAALASADHVISGQVAVGYQYHFHLETHACLCVPTEDGYTVYSSTQWTANVQTAVAGVLGITNNRYCPLIKRYCKLVRVHLSPCSVDVSVKRCGGGFGGKISRPNLTAAACALGAHATRRYVSFYWSLWLF